MENVKLSRAYRVVKITPDGEVVLPFVSVGPLMSLEKLPPPFDDSLGERWTLATNREEGDYSFFGSLTASDGDVFEFEDLIGSLAGESSRIRLETLTWERMAAIPVDGVQELKAAAPTDDLLQNFFIQNYLDDPDAYAAGSGTLPLPEGVVPALISLHALLEGTKLPSKVKKTGFPVGTIHKWSDGFSYEKKPDGRWRRLPGQTGADRGGEEPPTGSAPEGFDPSSVIPDAEGWVNKVPWIPENTRDHYFVSKDGAPPKPKAARKKLHDQIVARFLAGKTPAPADKSPTALVTIGSPSTGKSTIVAQLIASDPAGMSKTFGSEAVAHDDFVRCDPDLIKAELPEFNEAVQAKAKNAASAVHVESGYINDRLFETAIANRNSLVFDGLGQDPEFYEKEVIGRLKAAGYFVILITPFVPDVETVISRATDRGRRTGRWVNESLIRSLHPVIPKYFRRLMGQVHQYAIYDTNGGPGEVAPMIAHRDNTSDATEPSIDNNDLYNKFLSFSEAVAALLRKLAEAAHVKVVAPPLPLMISAEEAFEFYARQIELTNRVLAALPPKFKPDQGMKWPVSEPTAGTIGQPEE